MATELDQETVELVAQYVECATYEECRDFLQKHPCLIDKKVADSLFENGYMIWETQPHAISARFIRNGQIINYLLDIRKASGGQQDITLFFYRILEDKAGGFRKSFEEQCMSILKHVDDSWKRRNAEKAAKKDSGDA